MTATREQIADLNSGIEWAKSLMAEFKQKNIDEGINAAQALWLHHRIRAWECTFSGVNYTVDIVNMAASGDITTSCLALIYGTPDDMTQPYHWLSAERLAWLVAQMKAYLGWP